MRSSLVALPAFASLFIGCGGSSGAIAPINPQEPKPLLSGNWTIVVTSNLTNAAYNLGGYLSNTNGSLAATLHVVPGESGCFGSAEAILFTGTVTTSGAISLTSAAVANQVISVTGSTPGGGLLTGSYKIAGGCAAGDSGTVYGLVEPSFAGTYTGTLQFASGTTIGVNATLAQSGPNAEGEYSLSGTVQFSGSPCFTTGTITSSTVFGEYLQVTLNTDQAGVVQFTGIGVAVPSSTTIAGTFLVTAGSCAGTSGTVTLES